MAFLIQVFLWGLIVALLGVIVELLRGGVRRKSPTPEERELVKKVREEVLEKLIRRKN